MSCRTRTRTSLTTLLPFTLLASLACAGAGGSADSPDGAGARKPPPPALGEMKTGPAQPAGENMFWNGDFEEGTSLPWSVIFTAPAQGEVKVDNGELCLTINNPGSNPTDVLLRQKPMNLVTGHTYTTQFKAHATKPIKIRPRLGMSGPPYTEYWSALVEIGTDGQVHTGSFKMADRPDPDGDFAIHFGGAMGSDEPVTVCFDDMRLDDPEFEVPLARKRGPRERVRVNQVGYFPKAQKIAALAVPKDQPQDWQLLDSSGKVVASGKSKFFGEDRAAGEIVHWIDFSSFKTPGKGYVLQSGEYKSVPFDIEPDIYDKLKYDALAFFYHQRSDVPIEMPYAGDEKWTRPAGHKRDDKVKCAADAGCDYTLDVSGGWYDAGDHGKYVVNGGISVWTLADEWERAVYLGTNSKDFADGTMNIPEKGNKVPDLLDEVRYQMEFMLKMQVPPGKPKAGMVHHRIHDEGWTAIPTRPDKDDKVRSLRGVATGATLNLAGSAAQAARIFAKYDKTFSKKCLTAAERAWKAALENPNVIAPKMVDGGGGYGDALFSDELFWAAAELFITTGKPEYKEHLENSKHFKRIATNAGGGTASMSWDNLAALGTISLAVVPNKLGAEGVQAMRDQIIQTADQYLSLIQKRGYRVPVASDQASPWGSNSFILNDMIILGLAYDFTKDVKYMSGVIDSMDYILGRNPLSQSYVTGYGERPLQHPHHRFWANQADEKFPPPPPGIVSGGPNSNLEDPFAKGAGLPGCAPQKCFIDHIESWSTNEIAINWNAPFAWAVAWLDEHAK